MSISRDDVLYVAQLSRINLPEADLRRFTEQLGRILDYVNQLHELDTSRVEPMAHPHDVRNVFRPDEPGASLSPEEAVANAPLAKAHYFRVPRVIDEG